MPIEMHDIHVYKNTEENTIGSDTDLTYMKTETKKVLSFASQITLY